MGFAKKTREERVFCLYPSYGPSPAGVAPPVAAASSSIWPQPSSAASLLDVLPERCTGLEIVHQEFGARECVVTV